MYGLNKCRGFTKYTEINLTHMLESDIYLLVIWVTDSSEKWDKVVSSNFEIGKVYQQFIMLHSDGLVGF